MNISYYYNVFKMVKKLESAIKGSMIRNGLFIHVGSSHVYITIVQDGKEVEKSRETSQVGLYAMVQDLNILRLSDLDRIIKAYLYVPLDYEKEAKRIKDLPPHSFTTNEEGIKLCESIDRLQCISGPESLFSRTGHSQFKNNPLIPEMLKRCLQYSKNWEKIVGNIVLSGGGSTLSGFPERIYKEVVNLVPSDLASKVNVVADPKRDQYVWRGASYHTFNDICNESNDSY
ncbi:actin [Acrasis kona]|uniref:Actin n=1 Tax=Acrasis kona TaxID=1008807 RepID=A0AAW2ZLD1_9EUKA